MLTVDDPATIEVCELLNQLIIAAGKWDLGAQVVRAVAAALVDVDWTGILNVTGDFVSYGMDYELHDLEEAMAASAPAERIDDFKARGLR